MEAATSKACKDGEEKRSSSGVFQKVALSVVVLAISVGFFVGLELLRQRVAALEATVNRSNHYQGSSSKQRNRRESPIDFITLDDVRREIQAQLNSVTASQLCSRQDKICLPGPPGPKGDAGLKGRRGRKGYAGDKGDMGYPGMKGTQGYPGPLGPKGYEGPPGIDGLKGNAGIQGQIGDPGQKGEKGDAGVSLKGISYLVLKGNPGMPGQKGDVGEKGDAGNPGGPKGDPGIQGQKGDTGEAGKKGDVGSPGFDGPPGIKGETGPKGDMGYPGIKGEEGIAGLRGFKGFAGPPGLDGRKGDAGLPGIDGLNGKAGIPGRKGEPGPEGAKGGTGSRGNKGDTGTPGPKGEPGERGTKGDAGTPGKAPIVYVSPRTLSVMENDPVTFQCYAAGKPAPSFRWERVGKGEVPPQGPSGAMKITKAQAWHSGKYVCRAFNVYGMKEATVELKVEGKPGILEMLTSVSRKMTVNTYEDVTIFCHVIGYPKPLVTWLKADGSKLIEKRTEIRNDSLVIKQTEVGDSAEYICKAQNIHGTVEMRFPLTVKPRDGSRRENAARSCKELKTQIPSTPSGRYWVDPDLGSPDNAFEVYCDQETDGGGWALVWSYRFQQKGPRRYYDGYNMFMTPRPSFPTHSRPYWYQSPLSTTIPLDPSSPGAMNCSLWKTLGTEVLLKSDLINWYICKDRDRSPSGSIVNLKDGFISCSVTKVLVSRCSSTAPNHVRFDKDSGPNLSYTSDFYKGHHYILCKMAVMATSQSGGRIMRSCKYGSVDSVTGSRDSRGAWFVR